MRYLHVLDSLAGGGVETTLLQMLRVFRVAAPSDGGSDVHDVMALATGPLHRDLAAVAHRVTVASLPLDLAGVLASGYDVVHVLCERAAHRVAPILLAGSDAALVYSKHYDPPAVSRMQGGFEDAADECLLSASDAVTFSTLDLAAGHRLPPGRTTILRAAAAIDEALQVPPPAPELPPRILATGSLHPRDHLADLLPIMQIVHERLPEVLLRIAASGTPAETAAFKDRIADAGLAGFVSLAGAPATTGDASGSRVASPPAEPSAHPSYPAGDAGGSRLASPPAGSPLLPSSRAGDAGATRFGTLAAELAQARVLALPASAQGVPTAAIDAMAAARPVVAARSGHIGHVITDGSEGFLTTPGDFGAFAARLLTVLSQPELAWRMGAAGRTRAGLHDVRIVGTELLRVLRRAATARRRAAA